MRIEPRIDCPKCGGHRGNLNAIRPDTPLMADCDLCGATGRVPRGVAIDWTGEQLERIKRELRERRGNG